MAKSVQPAEQGQRLPAKPVETLQKYFKDHKDQIAAALPKHLTPDRMVRLAMTAFSQNKQLSECEPRSIFASVIVASQLGLEIGVAGQGFLVPYNGTATFVPGWQGLIDLVSRSGRGTCWTGAVFEGDEFDYALGDSPFVRHRPGGEDDPMYLTHTYAIGRVRDSQWPIIEVWPIKRVWKHRGKYNKVGDKHYSYRYPEMYARKIPLMQVLKYMPKSIELAAAMDLSNRVDEGRAATIETIDGNFMVVDIEPADGATDTDAGQGGKPASMRDQIRRKEEPAPEPPTEDDQQQPGPLAGFLKELTAVATVEDLDVLTSRAKETLEGGALAAYHESAKTKMAQLREESQKEE